MKNTRALLIVLSVTTGIGTVIACGGDDAAPPGDTPEGKDTSTTDSTSTLDSDVTQDARGDVAISDVGGDTRPPEFTGSSCTAASQCYSGLDAATLKGPAACLDATGGYCTHECVADTDCCATPGECPSGLKQVCASFENTDKKYCFLSCEAGDVAIATDAGKLDAGAAGTDYCQAFSGSSFECRSSGGGKENRKVCFPMAPVVDGGIKDAGDGG